MRAPHKPDTGRPVKADANNRIARDIMAGSPMDTEMPLGTAGLFRLPIQDKGFQAVAVSTLLAIGG